MSASLNVIALISGGKDSLFSILHCLANDHKVVALANLYPPSSTPNETDSSTEPPQDVDPNSYMYQTAGHTLLPHYSSALSLPLYRAPIFGSAVNTERDYSKTPTKDYSKGEEEDETESLVPLLKKVLIMHPSANALCTGAILSTYQRTRIENIALRLSLVPLSYLWQYPFLPAPFPSPGGLLEDMKAVGMKAQIVKVASGGLDDGMLWEDVLSDGGRKRVERAMAKFGGSVLGEGGEYETLVLDGPSGVWNETISVDEEERTVHRGEGGAAWVAITGGRVIQKTGEAGKDEWRKKLRIPEMLDVRFEKILRETQWLSSKDLASRDISRQSIWTHQQRFSYSKSTYTVSNITESGERVEDQIAKIRGSLNLLLLKSESGMDDVVFTTILLRSMSDFSVVNENYAKWFIKPNPPARVTVACGDALPRGVLVMLSVIIGNQTQSSSCHHCRGLHVQSRSYWAPANIGPYSQAISMRVAQESSTSIVFVAGQIPLVPASMRVVDMEENTEGNDHFGKFHKQAVLSAQHLWRIGIEMKVTYWLGAIAFIAAEDDIQYKAAMAWKIWKSLHLSTNAGDNDEEEEDDGPDAWDRKYGGCSSFSIEDSSPRHLPDFKAIQPRQGHDSIVPGFFAVQVDEIPRGCEIEWQSLGIVSDKICVQSYEAGVSKATICRAVDESVTIIYYSLVYAEGLNIKDLQNQAIKAIVSQDVLADDWTQWFSSHATVYTSHPGLFQSEDVQLVPCRRIWGSEGQELSAGLVLRLEQCTQNERLWNQQRENQNSLL
ncbi:hypothetical protein MMC14_001820 [Varicellaria rhodocarpa]|nr:hypothetical protein [Varicellaria rhodocarpa]